MTAIRTGRTARMLREARRLALQGRLVWVLGATKAHAEALRKQCEETPGILFGTPNSLRDFDWIRLRSPDMHPDTVVLIDHFVIETRFERLLTMLHRFDVEAAADRCEVCGQRAVLCVCTHDDL